MVVSGYAPFVTRREKQMPFYVTTIGNPRYQTVVHRPLGIEDSQLLYTISGRGNIFLNGKTYEVEQGMLVFLPPHTAHEYHCISERWETLYITFNGSGIRDFWDTEPAIWERMDGFSFESWYNKLYQYKYQPEMAKKLSIELYSMLLELKEHVTQTAAGLQKKQHMLTQAMYYLAEEKDPELEKIAVRLGISKSHFCRIFKEFTGYRPFEYMNLLRIQKGKELLKDSRMSIQEIAGAVGYESHSYFSMLFKRYVGMTPGEYRKS